MVRITNDTDTQLRSQHSQITARWVREEFCITLINSGHRRRSPTLAVPEFLVRVSTAARNTQKGLEFHGAAYLVSSGHFVVASFSNGLLYTESPSLTTRTTEARTQNSPQLLQNGVTRDRDGPNWSNRYSA